MQHDHKINIDGLTVREFCLLTEERGIRPTAVLTEYELQREPIAHEG